jgi:hypothetical protein
LFIKQSVICFLFSRKVCARPCDTRARVGCNFEQFSVADHKEKDVDAVEECAGRGGDESLIVELINILRWQKN